MRTGSSAHPDAAERCEVRGRPRPHSGPGARFNADREVRAPRRRRTLRGARTSSSAFRSRARLNADREVRAPRDAERWEVRGRPRPHSGLVQGSMRTGRSAHPDAAERCEVRGRSRPHSGPGARFNADREVRAPRRRRTLGGARTSSSAFRPRCKVQCGPGGPRTTTPPNTARCADVLVRIRARTAVQPLKRGSAFPDPPAFRGRGSRNGTCPPWARRSRSVRRRFPGAHSRPPSSPGRRSGRRRPSTGRSP